MLICEKYFHFDFFVHFLKSFLSAKASQWLIGGNANYSFIKSKDYKISSFEILPNAGYFFLDKFAGGLRPGFNSETTYSKYRTSAIFIGPFVRYYFLPADQKLNLFTDISFAYSWSKFKNLVAQYTSSFKFNYYQLGFMAGPSIFLNEHTSLEFTVGYKYSTGSPKDTATENSIRVGIGLQIHIGK